jgi:hypothetical protein
MSSAIIPIKTQKSGGKTVITRDDLHERSLKELGVTEADLEEFVRRNIELLFPEGDETLLIVGQQVKNKEAGRADLVAVDGAGNIVLVELKRDKADILGRREPFEFQAIRYAANYALIRTPQDLVQKLFAPYIEKHQGEPPFQQELAKGLTQSEVAVRLLDSFLQGNQARGAFNRAQRVVLISSSFDPQTLSACAWLAKSGIDLRCITIAPVEYGGQLFFRVERVIPPPSLDDYFVEIATPADAAQPAIKAAGQPKKVLPKMADLFGWGLVAAGDTLHIRGHDAEHAEMVDAENVRVQGQPMPYNDWGKQVTGWSTINIYEWTIHEQSGKSLDTLRREKLAELEAAAATGK